MLKDLLDFYMGFIFPVIFISVGVFTICVGIKAIFKEISEIKEMDKEKHEEKICLKK
ncbi:hypothetical protein PDQ37_28490 [Bacillus cereus]|nr:hypothetical protein [Bacillus cereus]